MDVYVHILVMFWTQIVISIFSVYIFWVEVFEDVVRRLILVPMNGLPVGAVLSS